MSGKDTPHPSMLSRRESRALARIGDLMAPAHGEYPAFSHLGCVAHAGAVLAYAPPDDVAQLRLLLRVLSFAPTFVLRLLLALTQHPKACPEPLASTLRTIDIGLRGLVLTLYFSGKRGSSFEGKTPLEVIDFELKIVR